MLSDVTRRAAVFVRTADKPLERIPSSATGRICSLLSAWGPGGCVQGECQGGLDDKVFPTQGSQPIARAKSRKALPLIGSSCRVKSAKPNRRRQLLLRDCPAVLLARRERGPRRVRWSETCFVTAETMRVLHGRG